MEVTHSTTPSLAPLSCANTKIKTKTYSLQAVFVALILLCLIFPDVIFKGASLQISDQLTGAENNLATYSISPKLFKYHPWWGGYSDYGGSMYQSEPMIQFMKYCIYHHESPFWNPYSAAGQLGPESLVDQKFSLFTVINAILGGSSKVFSFSTLGLFFLSIYFIFRIVRERLELSFFSGLGASIFYVLNGYVTANLSSNVSFNYFLIPACCFASLTFFESLSVLSFIGIIISFAALFTFTFLPTTIAAVLSLYGILIAYLFTLKEWKIYFKYSQLSNIFLLQVFGVVLAVCLLGFLYLPILESFKSTGMLSSYTQRTFFPAHVGGLLSLYSPSHFFESYSVAEDGAWNFIGNTVYHMGIVALGLVGCAITFKYQKFNLIMWSCIALSLLVLSRIFGMPGISQIISVIPVIGNLGCQYWWAALILPITLLVALGINNLERRNALMIPPILIMLFGIAVGIYVWHAYGLHAPELAQKIKALSVLFSLMLLSLVTFFVINNTKDLKLQKKILFGLLLLMFLELITDAKYLHYKTNDALLNPPPEIQFIKEHIGLDRTMTIGNELGIMHGVRPELGSAYQIQEVTSLNEGILPNYLNYFHKAILLGQDTATNAMFPALIYMQDSPDINKIDWHALDELGVKYFILPSYFTNYIKKLTAAGYPQVYQTPTTVIFENQHLFPRAFAVNDSSVGLNQQVPKDAQLVTPVTITTYHNSVVSLQGQVSKKSLVVLTDNWNVNWSAYYNGIKVPIVLVDHAFRGIWVDKGAFNITMLYRPKSLNMGILLSVSTSLILLLLFFFNQKMSAFIRRLVW